MALHPPAGWKVLRFSKPEGNDYIIVMKDDGSYAHTCLIERADTILWDFVSAFAVPATASVLTL